MSKRRTKLNGAHCKDARDVIRNISSLAVLFMEKVSKDQCAALCRKCVTKLNTIARTKKQLKNLTKEVGGMISAAVRDKEQWGIGGHSIEQAEVHSLTSCDEIHSLDLVRRAALGTGLQYSACAAVNTNLHDSSAALNPSVRDSFAAVETGLQYSSYAVDISLHDSSGAVDKGLQCNSSAAVNNGLHDSSAAIDIGLQYSSSAALNTGFQYSSCAAVDTGLHDFSVNSGLRDSSAAADTGLQYSSSAAADTGLQFSSSAAVDTGLQYSSSAVDVDATQGPNVVPPDQISPASLQV